MAKAIQLSETVRNGKHVAHITIEIPLEDLPDAVEHLDCEDLNPVQIERSVDAAHALRKIIEAEERAQAHSVISKPETTETDPKPETDKKGE
jgi:hypothetical protein